MNAMSPHVNPRHWHRPGFTLVEMAIVLIIISILLGAMVAGIGAQVDSANKAQTEQTLSDIREALLGFAAAQGRLPCPAAPNATGVESPTGGACGTPCTCTNNFDGLVPGRTLGVGPTDSNGYVVDAWNHQIHYAITNGAGNAFTTSATLIAGTMSLADPTWLSVCSTATGITAASCNTAPELTHRAVAVIYSTGKNGGSGGAEPDEAANPNPQSANNDPVFVSHDAVTAGAANGEFDDIMIWISPYVLYSRMITAGRLP
jgi:prepilin-type N-terminal cleavage/methylation domain-containing protein